MVSIFLFVGCVSATFALVSKWSLSEGSFNGWRFLGSKANPVHRLNVLRFEVAAAVEAGVAGNVVGVDFMSLQRLLSAAAFVHPMMKDVVVDKKFLVASSILLRLRLAVATEEAAFKVPSDGLLRQVFGVLDAVVDVSGKMPSGKQLSAGSPFLPLWVELVEKVGVEAEVVHEETVLRVSKAAEVSMVRSGSKRKAVR